MNFTPSQLKAYNGLKDRTTGAFLINGSAGSGKAQGLDNKILTENGWVRMGDIKVGDNVVTPKGTLSPVTEIHPQGKLDLYTVTFEDGRTTQCCENHLWKVYKDDKWQILPLKDFMNLHTLNVYIPLVDKSVSKFCKEDDRLAVLRSFGNMPLKDGIKITFIQGNKLKITKIDFFKNDEAQCITIEDEDHLYITDDYIVTHNTYITKSLINYYSGKKILCLAPTHQAKYQMIEAIGKEERIRYQTIASFLGTKASFDLATGKKVFIEGTKAVKKEVNMEDVILVDESSMLTSEQIKKIVSLSRDKLVIFLGDFCQLPPVKEDTTEEEFSRMITYTLTEQMRNAGDILELCNKLRNNIVYPTTETNDIIINSTKSEMMAHMLDSLDVDPSPFKTCYLAYTNKAVNNTRNLIHRCMYGNDDFNIGQYIRIEEPVGSGIDALTNGEMCQITKITQASDVVFEIDFDVFKLEVVSCTTKLVHNITCFRYKDQDKIQELLRDFYDEAGKAFKKYMKTKTQTDKTYWEDIIQLIKKSYEFTLIGSPYASTVHKSQGRSIDNVFLDTVDISKYGRDNTRALLYVGCSRTRHHLETIKI